MRHFVEREILLGDTGKVVQRAAAFGRELVNSLGTSHR